MTRRPLSPHERRALQVALACLYGIEPTDIAHTRTRISDAGFASLRGTSARACLPPEDGWCEVVAEGGGLPDERMAMLRVRADDGRALAREEIHLIAASLESCIPFLREQGFSAK